MSEQTLSPNVARNRVNRAVKTRMKILRTDSRPVGEIKGIDSPHVFAGRIAALLKQASGDNPGEWSEAYTEHVINRFADRYVELCRVAPIRERVAS